MLQPPGVGGLRQAFHRQGGVQAQGQGFVERRLEGGELAVDQVAGMKWPGRWATRSAATAGVSSR